MDLQTARHLSQLNTSFYSRVHNSFDATRQAPWPGWQRVRNEALARFDPTGELRVLDLACGNLRFVRFLGQSYPRVHAWGVDNCTELTHAAAKANGPHVELQDLDIVGSMLDGQNLSEAIHAPACHVCACFGFMHHVAMEEHRKLVLQALVEHTQPGGLVAVSFWQFAKSSRIMAKARPLSDKGDYLLGWQNETDVWRYCHSFEEDEVDRLAQSVAPHADEVARFWADGRTGDLNRYLVLQARSRG